MWSGGRTVRDLMRLRSHKARSPFSPRTPFIVSNLMNWSNKTVDRYRSRRTWASLTCRDLVFVRSYSVATSSRGCLFGKRSCVLSKARHPA
jgi:hypothetical protein